jgi:hypothetical protein
MRYQGASRRRFFPLIRRKTNAQSLCTCFWRLLSKDVTFGMVRATCDHEQKAYKMAEKPN